MADTDNSNLVELIADQAALIDILGARLSVAEGAIQSIVEELSRSQSPPC